ncbi:trypsin-like serine protease [Azospirillum brasilense]|uniref:trypsin-like serine peptidase n=1 Tax=Azospirillum argentinense TaxID=2970906 RepID=UPI00190E6B05|nr:trypsin-like peptidase domain-containing protein [Azospirillum argentinense]MBK3803294.1 trypsin-like serine protease [Azospirillum argentinense]
MSQVEVTSQTKYPWQSIVFITSTYANGEVHTGSGVMVGPNDVLTASHVVYDSTTGQSPIEITVTPAFDPSPFTAPFGSVDAVSWHYNANFDPNGDGLIVSGNGGAGLEGVELDYALLDLGVALGYETGWMEIDPTFVSGSVNLTGFPDLYGNNMMNDMGWVVDNPFDDFIDISGLEVHPGNSGGPVWYEENGVGHVVGIVSTGVAAHDVIASYGTLLDWIADNDRLIAAA